MTTFDDTPYLRGYRADSTLQDAIDKPIQFKYAKVSYETFSNEYTSEGWLGRKIIALPMVAFGLIKVIAEIFLAVFSPFLIKAHSFFIARDLQESFGWVISLVNDRYGQYHVEESRFHKTVYDHFFKSKHLPSLAEQGRSYRFTSDFEKNVKEGRLEEASKMFERLFGYEWKKNDCLKALAKAYLLKREIETAIRIMQALPLTHIDSTLNEELAAAHIENNKLKKALKIIQDMKGGSPKLKKDLTLAYIKRNKFEQAEKVVQMLTERKDQDPLLEQISNGYFNKGNVDSAFSTIKRVEDLSLISPLLAKITAYFQKNNNPKCYKVNEYHCIAAISVQNVSYRNKQLAEKFPWKYRLTNPEAAKRLDEEIKGNLSKLASNGFLLRCCNRQIQAIYQQIMSQDTGEQFVSKLVHNWWTDGKPDYSTASLLGRGWDNNKFGQTDVDRLEEAFSTELDEKFQEFLKLAPASVTIGKDPYAVFGLDRKASQAEIKTRYKKLCLSHHPDRIQKNSDETPEAFEKRHEAAKVTFQEITQAYGQLKE